MHYFTFTFSFVTPATLTSIDMIRYVDHSPKDNITQGQAIIIDIPGESLAYLDLKGSILQTQVKIVDDKGDPFVKENVTVLDDGGNPVKDDDGNDVKRDTQPPFPVTGLAHCMWQGVEVKLSETVVSEAASLYPFRTYFRTVLHRTQNESKTKQLYPELYAFDQPGDSFETLEENSPNTGAFWRIECSKNGKSFICSGPLLEDCCELDKYIYSGVKCQIKLIPQRPEFCLMSDSPDKKWRLHIEKVTLKARMIHVTSTITTAHKQALGISFSLSLSLSLSFSLFTFIFTFIFAFTFRNWGRTILLQKNSGDSSQCICRRQKLHY